VKGKHEGTSNKKKPEKKKNPGKGPNQEHKQISLLEGLSEGKTTGQGGRPNHSQKRDEKEKNERNGACKQPPKKQAETGLFEPRGKKFKGKNDKKKKEKSPKNAATEESDKKLRRLKDHPRVDQKTETPVSNVREEPRR